MATRALDRTAPRAAPEAAIVWSASLLHEVLPETAGRRLALVTHLFDA